MAAPADSSWDALEVSLQSLRQDTSDAAKGGLAAPLEAARNLARQYFRDVRPSLRVLAIDARALSELDLRVEWLFGLSGNGTTPEMLAEAIDSIADTARQISVAREYRLSDISFDASAPRVSYISEHEARLIATLEDLLPSAAKAYRQAILDSADTTRVSYRGPANEFREALREVLDHLAPDSDVAAQPGFGYEKPEKRPTRRQKVRYVLAARKTPQGTAKIPEELMELIESKVAGIACATYTMANVAAHIETERIEVLRVRRYVLLIFSELLEIHE